MRVAIVALLAFVAVACSSTEQKSDTSSSAASAAPCTADVDCAGGRRCAFLFGNCSGNGICAEATSQSATCADGPGGLCGCDGQPVETFCVVGIEGQVASRPMNRMGPCPTPPPPDGG